MNKLTVRQFYSTLLDLYVYKSAKKNTFNLIDNILDINNNIAPRSNKKIQINNYLKSILQNEVSYFLRNHANNDDLIHIINYLNGVPYPMVDIPNINIYYNDQLKEYKITEILDIISYHQYSYFFNKESLTTTAETLIKYSLNVLLYKNINIIAPDIKFKKNKRLIYRDLINNFIDEEIKSKLLAIVPNRILLQQCV